jgi:hypothetical protein
MWRRGDGTVADLECLDLGSEEGLYAVRLCDGFGLADGFLIVFCEVEDQASAGRICVLSVMRSDEPLTPASLEILRCRRVIAEERLV